MADGSIRQQIARRFRYRCEYCHYPEQISGNFLELEHIIPSSKKGQTSLDNLAYACGYCNRYKSNRTEEIDPLTGQAVRLFNPRRDKWDEHFRLDKTLGRFEGLTAIGRATIEALKINAPNRVLTRRLLIEAELF